MISLGPIFLVSAILFLGGWLLSNEGAGKYVTAFKRMAGGFIGIFIFAVYGWYWNNARYEKDNGTIGCILILLYLSGIVFNLDRRVGILIFALSYVIILFSMLLLLEAAPSYLSFPST